MMETDRFTQPEEPILSLKNVKTYYPIRSGVLSRVINHVKAVDGVSFDIKRNETLGLVGESGCGKSSIGRTIMHLEDPTGGQMIFDGEDITGYSKVRMRKVWPRMQMVFQDPYSSLNPRKTVESMLSEILRIHRVVPENEISDEIDRLLHLIGLNPDAKKRFPHEFSGGQRQRISIARALTIRPRFIICDEATSALDVSIQAQILALFKDLRDKLNLTYLFISHGLGAVKYISHRIAVMYLGKIVELAATEQIFAEPRHPYTQALLSAFPDPDPSHRGREKIVLTCTVPSPAHPPSGCRFRTRCPFAQTVCSDIEPELTGSGGRLTRCHFDIQKSDWKKVRQ
ncbi:MAG: ATP-binding cassette domain-containing protein [Spirochaetaceae bacterium]|jgi:peptide/nickel transport system ATP-binding protein/oligopeptide transport system ATP-binding protein|nr:ATP-binding cassette domain-containing protein [Spirochaetaceae bacterium]